MKVIENNMKNIFNETVDERMMLLNEMHEECDRTENEGGRILVEQFIAKLIKE